MAQLTDAQHKTVGHTVIYVPEEGPRMASPHAHRDKELVQRLEGIGTPLDLHVALLCYIGSNTLCIIYDNM